MPTPAVTHYPENSPETLLRVITLFLISDGEVSDAEMDRLQSLGVLDNLGASSDLFARVFDAYCDDLIDHAGTARYVGLTDPEWVDAVIAPVTDPDRRRFLAAALLHLVQADGDLGAPEQAVMQRVLERWCLDLHELTAAAGGGAS